MLQIQESLEEGLSLTYGVKKVLHETTSEFQTVSVLDTVPFGKCLIIDGLMQSSDVDERIYHECLVHPAMLVHPNPKSVYIGGAGEGSTVREVLKHNTVEKCVMVDIDGDVVRFCRDVLPQNAQAFNDSRLELIIDCAKKQLLQAETKFDIIIMDLDDPLEGGPCYQLYTKEFYTECMNKLNPGGVLVTQCSSAGVKNHSMVFTPVHNTLKQVFPKVMAYAAHVYSFADTWGFNLALPDANFQLPSAEKVDELIAARGLGDLFFLDGESFHGVFSLPKFLRKSMGAETRVLGDGHYAKFVGGGETVAEKGC
jgi:thermospermine synthase